MKYVCELSENTQKQIRKQLVKIGFCEEDIEIAMNSKISDLEEIINFEEV